MKAAGRPERSACPPRSFRPLLLLVPLTILLLAGCGRSTVVHRDHGGHAPRTYSQGGSQRDVIVRRGDTLYGIAFRAGFDYRDVARWNGIRPPYTIHPGERLHLHPGSGSARPVTAAPARPTRSSPPPASPGKTTNRPPPRSTAGNTRPTPSKPATAPKTPAPPAKSLGWRWPTDGALLNRFLDGDSTRQGIDIVGRGGQPVQAAAAGTVVYSGAGLVGYGELIIIKHSDEWLSAYGHNRRRLVDEGTQVGAGQIIAEMGSTGASRDMLHFEIRRNGKPVDPLPLLPPR